MVYQRFMKKLPFSCKTHLAKFCRCFIPILKQQVWTSIILSYCDLLSSVHICLFKWNNVWLSFSVIEMVTRLDYYFHSNCLFVYRSLEHPNLCRFMGGCIDPDNVCIFYEYCPKGSLADVLQNDAIPLNWAFRYAKVLQWWG